ncbi:colicin E3/pyocin S6 family cytotoxin [Pseudomonas chlororaphis]|uniref:S-type pyocin domain-containing protein n=1 Tax=Pseudomonas chlororaphis subsp. aurantiaca TaxID=86192 RepID=A0AAJ0ZGD8_9PSED|nr:colicin E3/pyocin S6 family cytotoxin [Pseudomonas chlororaphis]AZD73014.1 Colicin E3 [Pseudomonas chlororaphis subsp. aurantiaca]MBU4632035.1 S-type pyocin domain-containing protein [Pseudomonas chlororaphis subsp. aurantiaca]
MSGYVPNAPKGYRNRGIEPVDLGEQRWAEYKDLPAKPEAKPGPVGCVFAKSCTLPNGVINHSNPGGFVPVESLKQYGTFAVLGSDSAITAGSAALQWVGGSGSASGLVARLGGTLALAGSTAVGFAALLLPDDTSADSAFYTSEQYAQLSQGNTRVRVNVKHLPDGSVSVYGFYTGTKAEWQKVPVIEAKARGDQLVADIGNGLEVIWTPAADPKAVLGIPALEGVSLKPGTWVFPPTEQADKILVNPVHPPDYQDAIIWFPNTGIQPIYISLSVPGDHSYHIAPKGLAAFPDAVRDRVKSSVRGGGKKRTRWKDSKGRIYEWDSQHGAVEIYDKQGKHLGEFNPETGEQTKPAKPGRTTPK